MNRPSVLGFVYLCLALLFWAGNAIIGRSAPHLGIPPLALTFWRWGLALAIFAPLGLPRVVRQRAVIRTHWKVFAVYGVCAVGCFNTFLYTALQYTTAVQASLIQSILPVLVVLLAWGFLGQRIRFRQGLGVAISILGAALIVIRGNPRLLLALDLNVGDLWMLGAVSVWAVQTLAVRWIPKDVDLVAFQTVVIAIGLVFIVPFYLGEIARGRTMPLRPASVLFVAYAAVFASVLALTFFNLGVMRLGAHTAGFLSNLYPVFSSALAVLILGEAFRWFHLVGGGLTLSGIYFATARQSATPPPTAAPPRPAEPIQWSAS